MVRGHHSVLSPVQLPYSLPFEILDKMVVHYKALLQAEIIKMMTPTGKKELAHGLGGMTYKPVA
jgi:hypothetical protein